MQSLDRLNITTESLIKSFIIRRAFRIFPLSTLCIVLTVLLHIPATPWSRFESYGWANLVSNLALTTNLTFSEPILAPLWSLPVEFQMYLALPFLFLVVGRKRTLIGAAIIWLLSVVCAIIQPFISGRLNVTFFGPCFIVGVVSFTMIGRPRRQFSGYLWLPYLFTMIVFYIGVEEHIADIHNEPLQWIFCLMIGVTIPYFCNSPSIILNNSAALVARYSYGIYLFHCIALWIGCVLFSAPWVVQWFVVIIVVCGLSGAAYHILEKPMIDLGARLAQSLYGLPTKDNRTKLTAEAVS